MIGEALSVDEALGMSREQALRTLATAEGVPESDRRLALIMLGGQAITPADEQRLRGFRPRAKPMVVAVAFAMRQIDHEAARERIDARGEVLELSGAFRG